MSSLSYSQSILHNFQLVNKNFVDTIPIEFIHNKIFMPVKLNNRIYHFILDTGASCCALHNHSIALQSDTIGKMGIVDVNNNEGWKAKRCLHSFIRKRPWIKGYEG